MGKGEYGLVVDIGGGTSDFSVFSRDGDHTTIIASQGVRIGGTDFDRAISIARVMPLLGMGAEIRNTLGAGTHLAPNAIYNGLATWQKIPFLYSAQNRSMARDFAKLGVDPAPFGHLQTVLEMELGHDIAFAVEAGKITLNAAQGEETQIDLDMIAPDLRATLTHQMLQDILAEHAQGIAACAQDTLSLAGITADQIAKVVFVGGSSLLSIVENAMTGMFPQAHLERAEAFTAVADGLARAAYRM